MSAYLRHVEWRFRVCGVDLAVTSHDDRFVEISETRKNGQEDTHFRCTLERDGDEWAVENRKELPDWYDVSPKLLDAIAEYVNKHGAPEAE